VFLITPHLLLILPFHFSYSSSSPPHY
jgi:hypothetical protein